MLRDVISDEAASAIRELIMPVPNHLNLSLIVGIDSDEHHDIMWSVPHDFNVVGWNARRPGKFVDLQLSLTRQAAIEARTVRK